MADAGVKVNDLGPKTVDVSELTRADGAVVERQRAVVGDDQNPGQFAEVRGGRLKVAPPNREGFLARIGVTRRRAKIFARSRGIL